MTAREWIRGLVWVHEDFAGGFILALGSTVEAAAAHFVIRHDFQRLWSVLSANSCRSKRQLNDDECGRMQFDNCYFDVRR